MKDYISLGLLLLCLAHFAINNVAAEYTEECEESDNIAIVSCIDILNYAEIDYKAVMIMILGADSQNKYEITLHDVTYQLADFVDLISTNSSVLDDEDLTITRNGKSLKLYDLLDIYGEFITTLEYNGRLITVDHFKKIVSNIDKNIEIDGNTAIITDGEKKVDISLNSLITEFDGFVIKTMNLSSCKQEFRVDGKVVPEHTFLKYFPLVDPSYTVLGRRVFKDGSELDISRFLESLLTLSIDKLGLFIDKLKKSTVSHNTTEGVSYKTIFNINSSAIVQDSVKLIIKKMSDLNIDISITDNSKVTWEKNTYTVDEFLDKAINDKDTLKILLKKESPVYNVMLIFLQDNLQKKNVNIKIIDDEITDGSISIQLDNLPGRVNIITGGRPKRETLDFVIVGPEFGHIGKYDKNTIKMDSVTGNEVCKIHDETVPMTDMVNILDDLCPKPCKHKYSVDDTNEHIVQDGVKLTINNLTSIIDKVGEPPITDREVVIFQSLPTIIVDNDAYKFRINNKTVNEYQFKTSYKDYFIEKYVKGVSFTLNNGDVLPTLRLKYKYNIHFVKPDENTVVGTNPVTVLYKNFNNITGNDVYKIYFVREDQDIFDVVTLPKDGEEKEELNYKMVIVDGEQVFYIGDKVVNIKKFADGVLEKFDIALDIVDNVLSHNGVKILKPDELVKVLQNGNNEIVSIDNQLYHLPNIVIKKGLLKFLIKNEEVDRNVFLDRIFISSDSKVKLFNSFLIILENNTRILLNKLMEQYPLKTIKPSDNNMVGKYPILLTLVDKNNKKSYEIHFLQKKTNRKDIINLLIKEPHLDSLLFSTVKPQNGALNIVTSEDDTPVYTVNNVQVSTAEFVDYLLCYKPGEAISTNGESITYNGKILTVSETKDMIHNLPPLDIKKVFDDLKLDLPIIEKFEKIYTFQIAEQQIKKNDFIREVMKNNKRIESFKNGIVTLNDNTIINLDCMKLTDNMKIIKPKDLQIIGKYPVLYRHFNGKQIYYKLYFTYKSDSVNFIDAKQDVINVKIIDGNLVYLINNEEAPVEVFIKLLKLCDDAVQLSNKGIIAKDNKALSYNDLLDIIFKKNPEIPLDVYEQLELLPTIELDSRGKLRFMINNHYYHQDTFFTKLYKSKNIIVSSNKEIITFTDKILNMTLISKYAKITLPKDKVLVKKYPIVFVNNQNEDNPEYNLYFFLPKDIDDIITIVNGHTYLDPDLFGFDKNNYIEQASIQVISGLNSTFFSVNNNEKSPGEFVKILSLFDKKFSLHSDGLTILRKNKPSSIKELNEKIHNLPIQLLLHTVLNSFAKVIFDINSDIHLHVGGSETDMEFYIDDLVDAHVAVSKFENDKIYLNDKVFDLYMLKYVYNIHLIPPVDGIIEGKYPISIDIETDKGKVRTMQFLTIDELIAMIGHDKNNNVVIIDSETGNVSVIIDEVEKQYNTSQIVRILQMFDKNYVLSLNLKEYLYDGRKLTVDETNKVKDILTFTLLDNFDWTSVDLIRKDVDGKIHFVINHKDVDEATFFETLINKNNKIVSINDKEITCETGETINIEKLKKNMKFKIVNHTNDTANTIPIIVVNEKTSDQNSLTMHLISPEMEPYKILTAINGKVYLDPIVFETEEDKIQVNNIQISATNHQDKVIYSINNKLLKPADFVKILALFIPDISLADDGITILKNNEVLSFDELQVQIATITNHEGDNSILDIFPKIIDKDGVRTFYIENEKVTEEEFREQVELKYPVVENIYNNKLTIGGGHDADIYDLKYSWNVNLIIPEDGDVAFKYPVLIVEETPTNIYRKIIFVESGRDPELIDKGQMEIVEPPIIKKEQEKLGLLPQVEVTPNTGKLVFKIKNNTVTMQKFYTKLFSDNNNIDFVDKMKFTYMNGITIDIALLNYDNVYTIVVPDDGVVAGKYVIVIKSINEDGNFAYQLRFVTQDDKIDDVIIAINNGPYLNPDQFVTDSNCVDGISIHIEEDDSETKNFYINGVTGDLQDVVEVLTIVSPNLEIDNDGNIDDNGVNLDVNQLNDLIYMVYKENITDDDYEAIKKLPTVTCVEGRFKCSINEENADTFGFTTVIANKHDNFKINKYNGTHLTLKDNTDINIIKLKCLSPFLHFIAPDDKIVKGKYPVVFHNKDEKFYKIYFLKKGEDINQMIVKTPPKRNPQVFKVIHLSNDKYPCKYFINSTEIKPEIFANIISTFNENFTYVEDKQCVYINDREIVQADLNAINKSMKTVEEVPPKNEVEKLKQLYNYLSIELDKDGKMTFLYKGDRVTYKKFFNIIASGRNYLIMKAAKKIIKLVEDKSEINLSELEELNIEVVPVKNVSSKAIPILVTVETGDDIKKKLYIVSIKGDPRDILDLVNGGPYLEQEHFVIVDSNIEKLSLNIREEDGRVVYLINGLEKGIDEFIKIINLFDKMVIKTTDGTSLTKNGITLTTAELKMFLLELDLKGDSENNKRVLGQLPKIVYKDGIHSFYINNKLINEDDFVKIGEDNSKKVVFLDDDTFIIKDGTKFDMNSLKYVSNIKLIRPNDNRIMGKTPILYVKTDSDRNKVSSIFFMGSNENIEDVIVTLKDSESSELNIDIDYSDLNNVKYIINNKAKTLEDFVHILSLLDDRIYHNVIEKEIGCKHIDKPKDIFNFIKNIPRNCKISDTITFKRLPTIKIKNGKITYSFLENNYNESEFEIAIKKSDYYIKQILNGQKVLLENNDIFNFELFGYLYNTTIEFDKYRTVIETIPIILQTDEGVSIHLLDKNDDLSAIMPHIVNIIDREPVSVIHDFQHFNSIISSSILLEVKNVDNKLEYFCNKDSISPGLFVRKLLLLKKNALLTSDGVSIYLDGKVMSLKDILKFIKRATDKVSLDKSDKKMFTSLPTISVINGNIKYVIDKFSETKDVFFSSLFGSAYNITSYHDGHLILSNKMELPLDILTYYYKLKYDIPEDDNILAKYPVRVITLNDDNTENNMLYFLSKNIDPVETIPPIFEPVNVIPDITDGFVDIGTTDLPKKEDYQISVTTEGLPNDPKLYLVNGKVVSLRFFLHIANLFFKGVKLHKNENHLLINGSRVNINTAFPHTKPLIASQIDVDIITTLPTIMKTEPIRYIIDKVYYDQNNFYSNLYDSDNVVKKYDAGIITLMNGKILSIGLLSMNHRIHFIRPEDGNILEKYIVIVQNVEKNTYYNVHFLTRGIRFTDSKFTVVDNFRMNDRIKVKIDDNGSEIYTEGGAEISQSVFIEILKNMDDSLVIKGKDIYRHDIKLHGKPLKEYVRDLQFWKKCTAKLATIDIHNRDKTFHIGNTIVPSQVIMLQQADFSKYRVKKIKGGNMYLMNGFVINLQYFLDNYEFININPNDKSGRLIHTHGSIPIIINMNGKKKLFFYKEYLDEVDYKYMISLVTYIYSDRYQMTESHLNDMINESLLTLYIDTANDEQITVAIQYVDGKLLWFLNNKPAKAKKCVRVILDNNNNNRVILSAKNLDEGIILVNYNKFNAKELMHFVLLIQTFENTHNFQHLIEVDINNNKLSININGNKLDLGEFLGFLKSKFMTSYIVGIEGEQIKLKNNIAVNYLDLIKHYNITETNLKNFDIYTNIDYAIGTIPIILRTNGVSRLFFINSPSTFLELLEFLGNFCTDVVKKNNKLYYNNKVINPNEFVNFNIIPHNVDEIFKILVGCRKMYRIEQRIYPAPLGSLAAERYRQTKQGYLRNVTKLII